jgi:hypothetical protein
LVRKVSRLTRVNIPIGVVSKNDIGDRKTLAKAALNMLRLAAKVASLMAYVLVSRNMVDVMQ